MSDFLSMVWIVLSLVGSMAVLLALALFAERTSRKLCAQLKRRLRTP